jgi:transcriptional regulator
MYIPTHFEETDPNVLHALIRSHPLGAWVTTHAGELAANHIPFLIDSTRGAHGTLIGHVARANPVWQALDGSAESLVIFQGAEAYISPSWYPSKHAHGKMVPTWNYAVVHAYGPARAIEDPAWLLQCVTQLTNTHEATHALPWKVTDAPADYVDKLLQQIVGIEIPISKLIGKWKVSQNRALADKLGAAAGLMARDDARAQEMAALVTERAGLKNGV